jgi:hypothetical protein
MEIDYIEKEINLVFDEPSHTYTNGDTGEKFTSVTTVIGKYEEKFNGDYWGMYTALKNAGLRVRPDNNKQYIHVNNIKTSLSSLYSNSLYAELVSKTKEGWKETTIKSHIRGNKIHNELEDNINLSKEDYTGKTNDLIQPLRDRAKTTGLVIFETKHDLDKTDLGDTYPEIYKCLLEFINQGCTLIAEKKIYTSKYMIAGMIDVLVVKGKKFAIVDWKTNKDELKFISGYYKKVKEGDVWVKGTEFIQRDDRLKYPIDNLQKCKGIIYSLQLSLYAYIMELWGYKLINNGLMIFHIRPRRKPLRIPIQYYKGDVGRMLEHHKKIRVDKKEESKTDKGFLGLGVF